MNVAAVRSATEAERQKVVAVITLSFASDPLARWSLPDVARYLMVMPEWTAAYAGNGLAHGATFVVDGLEGAAMWLPPGVEPDTERMMQIVEANAEGEQATELIGILEQMSAFHPQQPCWYLPMIGVDPVLQGRGFGALLMRHATMRCDAEGAVAYLESSNPRNIPLYLRHGFEIVGTVQVGTSPTVTPMVRRPR
jgi:ribosomal protein S18 acetylase RimI-like enzyme